MRIYLRKIDEQCINKQISYTKDILKEFLDGKGEKDTIVCEGKNSHHVENVALLLSTDPRFDNGIKRVLASEGEYKAGDIMVMYKLKNKYLVELIKNTDSRYNSFTTLFDENDRHLLTNIDDIDKNSLKEEKYSKFKHLLSWFVKQLNINNNLEEGIRTSGQGYKDGSAIRELYKEWRDYGNFTLDCSIQSGYLSTSKANYIHKTRTGINICPNFNTTTKEVLSLSLNPFGYDPAALSEVATLLMNKEYLIEDLSLFDGNEPNNKVKELFDDYCDFIDALSPKSKENEDIDYDNCDRLHIGTNIILYGVPGAGKSYTIENEYSDEDTKKERVVFHPDYTYSDFVGQILPKSENGDVTYQFMPGPFTKIVDEAYHNPNKKFILVIEEINRGNAPAIFGDIFQLLDRDGKKEIKDEDGNLIPNKNYCASSYGIINADIAKIVYGDENHEIKIPSNMSIICTMNTSDQNVFTLDTAFQRRWNMRLIENVFKKDTPEEKEFAEKPILDTDISWEEFCEAINKLILEKNQNMTSSEDKRLGTHFVNIDDLVEVKVEDMEDWSDDLDEKSKEILRKQAALRNRRFPEKVIKYLWDDAFKFYRDEIFRGEYDSLEKIIRKFSDETNNDRFDIFKDNIKAALEEISKASSDDK